MMQDLEGSDIPIKLLIDWGHALFKPLPEGRGGYGSVV